MSNEHLLKPFPTNLSQTGSNGTGKQSEALFIKQCESLGHEIYEPRSDRGIDFVVVTGNGCRKTVQVTAATPHPNKENGFNVNKPISRIRTDVDILALLVSHDELITVNLPLIGEVKIPKSQITGDSAHSWFLLPKRALVHTNACDYYKFKTSVWYFRLDELKPPLIAARENWGLLERKSMTGIEEQFGLLLGNKV